MKNIVFSAAAIFLIGTSGTYAADCGEPPMDKPTLPAVSSSTTAEEIRGARSAVLTYSGKVTEYLSCMDNWIVKLRPYMTKEQNSRFSDDTANLHEERISVEEEMNELIRAYRRVRRDAQNG